MSAPRRSEKFGLGFNIGGLCMGLLIIVAGICNMARRGAVLTLGLVTTRTQVWHTGSPQRIILGIYFLVAGAFGAVVEVMEVKLCVEINQCVGCTRQFFTKSCLGDDAAVLARSSGEEPTSPRHRAGVASMAWRTNAPSI